VQEVYGDNVRIVWKHLPLSMHKDAVPAAVASVAAQKQGKFWEFHDKIFADQRNLDLDTFKKHAQEVGLNVARFEKDFLDLSNRKEVDDDAKEAAALGVTGTPGFFVNGKFLSGAKPFEEFAKVINEELTRKGIPVPPEAASD
jgi:protein-disulfide isomerase